MPKYIATVTLKSSSDILAFNKYFSTKLECENFPPKNKNNNIFITRKSVMTNPI